MPPLPKKKHTRARKGNRNAHNAIKLPSSSVCPCSRQERIQPHRTCQECGNFNGRTMPGNWPQANLLEQVEPIESASVEPES